MNRFQIHLSDREFPEIYSCVAFFTQYYDNAEKECQTVLRAVIEAFRQKCASCGRPVSEEEAVRFVCTPVQNPRNAGRKRKYTDGNREEMIRLLAAGETRQQVADRFGCSVSFIEKLERQNRKQR